MTINNSITHYYATLINDMNRCYKKMQINSVKSDLISKGSCAKL